MDNFAAQASVFIPSFPGSQLGFCHIFQQTEETESTNNQLSDYGYEVQ